MAATTTPRSERKKSGAARRLGRDLPGRLRPTIRRTYGWRSSSILAALLNAVILLIAVGGIATEAIRRFEEPGPVSSGTVIVVAAVGIAINAATALLFMTGRRRDLNIRGAFLHMVADAGVSAGVVVAGLGIFLTGWAWLDPLVSLMREAAEKKLPSRVICPENKGDRFELPGRPSGPGPGQKPSGLRPGLLAPGPVEARRGGD